MVTDSVLILYISMLLYIQSYKDRGRADRDNLAVTCPAMLYLSALADEQRTRHSRRFFMVKRALWGIFRFLDEFSRGVEGTNIKQISCGPEHRQSGGKLLHVTADVVYQTKSEALLISVEVQRRDSGLCGDEEEEKDYCSSRVQQYFMRCWTFNDPVCK